RTHGSGCGHCTARALRSWSLKESQAGPSRRCACPIAKWFWSRTLMQAEWRALIADDEPAARRGVRQLLAAFPDFAVVGECRDGREPLEAFASLNTDISLLAVPHPE